MCGWEQGIRMEVLCFDQYNFFHGHVNDYMNIVLTKFRAKLSATAAVANRTVKCDTPPLFFL